MVITRTLNFRGSKGRDDLHAWVETAGEILIGESALPHQPMVRFEFPASAEQHP